MWSMSFVVAAATWSAGAAEPELPVRVRQAIERSIPYIEKQGVSWIEKKKCVSCHRVGTMLWSLSAAQQRGFEVSDRLDEWFAWAFQKSTENEKARSTRRVTKRDWFNY